MSRALQLALQASMESEVELVNPVTDQQETNIDEVLLEINESKDEVDQSEEVVEVLEGAEESMEALAASLEACIEEGGMSPQTARAHNQAMAIALKALPLDVSRVTVSSESFGGTGDKLVATQEALEGVKETLMKIWEGIKKALAKAWAAVKNFVTTIGKSSSAIKSAGEQLIKQAAATKGKAEGKMDAASITKALHVGGKLTKSVSAQLADIATGGAGVVASANAAAAGLKEIAGKMASGHYEHPGDYVAFSDKVDAPLPKGELPGGKKIETNDNGLAVLNSVSSVNEIKIEVDVPTIDQIKQIGQAILKVASFLSDYSNKTFNALEKSVDTFVADQDKLVKKAGFDKEETAKTRGNLKEISKFSSSAKGCGPQYMAYAASSAKAAFTFGKAALKQYKDEAPAKSEKKEEAATA